MANTFYDELISTDWLGRSESDYTYTQIGLTFGWRDTLTEGEPFSNFLLRVGDAELPATRKISLVKQACEMLKSRMLIGLDADTQITFLNEFNNYATADKKKICVTLEPMSTTDPDLIMPSFNHALDPILGYLVHEMAHIVYTEDGYFDYLKQFKDNEAKLKAMIMNVIEDERIEANVAIDYSGYVPYIGKAKDYCFGKKYEAEKDKLIAKGGSVELSDIERLANVFITLVRYPKGLTRDEVDYFESEILEFQEALKQLPRNTDELIASTEAVYEVFKKFFEENEDDSEGDGSDDPEDSDDSEDSSKSDASQGGGSKDSNQQDSEDGGDSDGDEGSSDKDGTPNAGKGKGGKGGTKQSAGTDKALNDALGDFIEIILEVSPTADTDGKSITPKDLADMLDVSSGDYIFESTIRALEDVTKEKLKEYTSSIHNFPSLSGTGCMEHTIKVVEASKYKSISHYDEAVNGISMYASSLRARLLELNRNVRVTNTGLHEGDFDGDLLTDALIGAKNVYSETYDIANQGATIGLLIDESGSMDNFGRYRRAMEIAVMFERALRGVNNIDFYCYGHTTVGYSNRDGYLDYQATILNKYYEGRKRGNPKDLGLISASGGNNDGLALLETVSRIRTFETDSKKPLILFMISDGEPSATPPSKFGYDAKAYLKHCVDKVERTMNTQVIHVAIEANIPSELMYNSYVKMTDYSTLVKDLGSLLKKIVTKQQNNIITL